MRGFHFRKSDEGADRDVVYNFRWPNLAPLTIIIVKKHLLELCHAIEYITTIYNGVTLRNQPAEHQWIVHFWTE